MKTAHISAVLGIFLAACHGGNAPIDAGVPDDAAISANNLTAPDGAVALLDDLAVVDGANPGPALVAARPYKLKVPVGYDPTQPTPLLIMLHGYNSDAALHEAYFQFAPLADTKKFLYVYPDGSLDFIFKRGWNATDACCFFQPQKPDDLGYLTAVLDDVVAKYNVDPKRVFVLGHSNGGFMTNRLACELSPRIAAIVSMAGAVWKDPASCVTTSPVAMLQVHAENDPTIDYNGGKMFFAAPPYPSAHETVATWAAKNGCDPTLHSTTDTVDLVSSAAGAETTVERYTGCSGNSAVELWTMHGITDAATAHQPPINASFAATMWEFLSAHPKP